MNYPEHLLRLIESLKRLPGVGNRSAERFAFQMLGWKPEQLNILSKLIHDIPNNLKHCEICGCLMGKERCEFCCPSRARADLLCIIATPKDAFAIEGTRDYKGHYHVLGGLLSPLDGRGPEQLNFSKILKRIQSNQITEVIIALDSTLEGDTTSLYLKRELEALPIKISRLAFGLPMGSSFEYVDGGTLAQALAGRGAF